jgi:alpha-galactosidase
MTTIGFSQGSLAAYAKPGHWNDPDMLEVGNGAMSQTEYQTHFSLWALLAAPLLAGNDLRTMTAETRAILLNKDVIAVNQDKLGKAASRLAVNGETEVWARPLDGGAYAVGLFNRGAAEAEVSVKWADLGSGASAASNGTASAAAAAARPRVVRDLWAGADRGVMPEGFSAKVAPHGVVMLRVSPSR